MKSTFEIRNEVMLSINAAVKEYMAANSENPNITLGCINGLLDSFSQIVSAAYTADGTPLDSEFLSSEINMLIKELTSDDVEDDVEDDFDEDNDDEDDDDEDDFYDEDYE